MIKNYRLYFKKIFIAFSFLFCVLAAFGQSVQTSVSKKDILIGEPISYIMQINLPSADYKVSINIPDSIPHFDIIQKSGGNGIDKKGNAVWQQTIVFTSFDSGSWLFPAFSYRINRMNTTSQLLNTDTFRVNVGYMALDKGGNPRDINPVIEVNYFDWFWVWVGAGIFLLLILGYILYRYFKKRKNKLPPDSKIGAYDEAMSELKVLENANQQHSLPVKEFHTRLADVLRIYYNRSEHQDISGKTTNEILSKLRSHELKAETQSQLAEALQTGDAVKYAKYNSTFTENDAALTYLKNTIDELENSRPKKS